MSYLVLARKYRPRTFAEVAGQEVAMRVLQGALREGRVGHAYLFSGPRGTGKTTSARLLAKALNCERGPTPEPCGTCARCVAIDAGAEVDVIEIDAASNRGIDDARALREEVAYTPMNARFKVYIVDEVHMLTKEAFNALLKTLEEPPPHVKFLFATTEPHKVIETIRSRCQMVALSLIDEGVISKRLAEILALEGIEPGPGVVEELARQARGSMRDALSLTDQLLALVGERPAVEDVRRLAGPASGELIEALTARLRDRDQPGVLAVLAPHVGGEAEITGALLEHLRLALVAVLAPPEAAVLVPDEARREALSSLARDLGPARVQIWLQELLACRERIALLPEHARVVLEVTLLDLAREDATLPLGELAGRLEALEGRLGGAPAPRASAPGPERASRAPAAAGTAAPPRARSSSQAPPPPATGSEALGSRTAGDPSGSDRSAAAAPPEGRGGGPSAGAAPGPGDVLPAGGPASGSALPGAPTSAGDPSATAPGRAASQRPPQPTADGPQPSSGGGVSVAEAPPRAQPATAVAAPDSAGRAQASRQPTPRPPPRAPGTGRVEWKPGRPPPPPGDDDTFTREVTDLFTGSIET